MGGARLEKHVQMQHLTHVGKDPIVLGRKEPEYLSAVPSDASTLSKTQVRGVALRLTLQAVGQINHVRAQLSHLAAQSEREWALHG